MLLIVADVWTYEIVFDGLTNGTVVAVLVDEIVNTDEICLTDETVVDLLTDETTFDGFTDETLVNGLIDDTVVHNLAEKSSTWFG